MCIAAPTGGANRAALETVAHGIRRSARRRTGWCIRRNFRGMTPTKIVEAGHSRTRKGRVPRALIVQKPKTRRQRLGNACRGIPHPVRIVGVLRQYRCACRAFAGAHARYELLCISSGLQAYETKT